MESILLTTPVTPPPRTSLSIRAVTMNVAVKLIEIQLIGDDGTQALVRYPTPPPDDHPSQIAGDAFLKQINTTNFSSVSLMKRLYQRLIQDGYVDGTVQGVPDP